MYDKEKSFREMIEAYSAQLLEMHRRAEAMQKTAPAPPQAERQLESGPAAEEDQPAPDAEPEPEPEPAETPCEGPEPAA